jgi:serine protease
VADVAHALASRFGGQVGFVYEHGLRGFSVRMPEARARALAQDPRVRYVEEDGVVEAAAVQNNAPWGLDRVDQRSRPLNGRYEYGSTGAGVNVYILDTGIRTTHVDFGGRAYGAFTSISDSFGTSDCNGHGTHVASTVAGATWGVAKQARVYSVRVLACNGSGTTSGVIAGVNWVTQYHIKPAVANMSLGGGASTALDDAVRASINAGVTYVVAAGNENVDACTRSPARVNTAITVANSTIDDIRASSSNWGSCVNLFAPGTSITAAYHTSNTAIATLSGTSMAAPHVAGAAALRLQVVPWSTPSSVSSYMAGNASPGRISDRKGSPDRLLFVEQCGNNYCHGSEDSWTCPQDCGDVCGDGYCGPSEDASSCPNDCGYCGDGICCGGEDAWSCPSDCSGGSSLLCPM